MMRPFTDFCEALSIQSDDNWIVDFPYNIQGRQQHTNGHDASVCELMRASNLHKD